MSSVRGNVYTHMADSGTVRICRPIEDKESPRGDSDAALVRGFEPPHCVASVTAEPHHVPVQRAQTLGDPVRAQIRPLRDLLSVGLAAQFRERRQDRLLSFLQSHVIPPERRYGEDLISV